MCSAAYQPSRREPPYCRRRRPLQHLHLRRPALPFWPRNGTMARYHELSLIVTIKEKTSDARYIGGRPDNGVRDGNPVRARSTRWLQPSQSRSRAGEPRRAAQPSSAAGPYRSHQHHDWGRTSIQPAGRYAGWNAIAPARCAARGDRSKKAGALKVSDPAQQSYQVKLVAAGVHLQWLRIPRPRRFPYVALGRRSIRL